MDLYPQSTHKKHRRTIFIKIRVTKEELEFIQVGAKVAGMSVSAYLRKLALDDRDSRTLCDYEGFLQRRLKEGL